MKKKTIPGLKIICLNRKASFNYFFHELIEAGLVLKGSEIKSKSKTVNICTLFGKPPGVCRKNLIATMHHLLFDTNRDTTIFCTIVWERIVPNAVSTFRTHASIISTSTSTISTSASTFAIYK